MIRPLLRKARGLLTGEGLRARALRGSALTVTSRIGSNGMRLLSNLILTRLLFPEAFGLMALVTVFVGGLQMFSDIGVGASIIQNRRGDDPAFLNTAWTLQIARGVVLWIGACALSLPLAALYGEPMLAELLPVAALGTILSGASSTKLVTANRHIMLGRLTLLEFGSQIAGLVLMAGLAWVYPSVWVLVIGGLFGGIVKMIGSHVFLAGPDNRLHFDRAIASELVRFGKYIFLSTIAGYLLQQSDRAILGAYVSLEELGVYSIGVTMGALPLMLGRAVGQKVVFPLYRMRPPAESARNKAHMRRVRRLIIGAVLGANAVLALVSVPLIDLLYDPRYAAAGPVVTLICLATVPQVSVIGYMVVLLANGNSRQYAMMTVLTALVQVPVMFLGVIGFGMAGAAVAAGFAVLVTHPLRVRLIRPYEAWDGKADAVFLVLGFLANGIACWLYRDEILALLP